MFSKIYAARNQWRKIAYVLGLKKGDVDNIKHEHGNDGNDTCLEEVIYKWLKKRSLNPTWKQILCALRHKTVEEEGLAEDIESELKRTESQDSDAGMNLK